MTNLKKLLISVLVLVVFLQSLYVFFVFNAFTVKTCNYIETTDYRAYWKKLNGYHCETLDFENGHRGVLTGSESVVDFSSVWKLARIGRKQS